MDELPPNRTFEAPEGEAVPRPSGAESVPRPSGAESIPRPSGPDIGAHREARQTWPAGKVVAQRYELERRLGGGSMGDVYLAHDRLLRKPVALKVLHPELAQNRDTVRRFLREVALAHSVTHRNVVRIYDTGEEEGLPFFTMEFLQGQTLEELLEEASGRDGSEKLSIREIRDISFDVLDGMEAAHRVGVVHRDLKPGNVMLTHRGAIVMDFGVAGIEEVPDKLPSAANLRSLVRTEAGTIFGSPAYMAPELWEGATASVQSDLYAFGVMLYQMITGRLPYDAKTPAAYLQLLGSTQPLPIRSFRRDTPWALVRLASRCMATDPEERPATAAAAATLVAPRRVGERRRLLVAMILASVAAVTAVALWPEPTWRALGLPDATAEADLASAVRAYDWGDEVTALRHLDRLSASVPRSAAVVFWRATVQRSLRNDVGRADVCTETEELIGSPYWKALAVGACSSTYDIALPFPEALDDPITRDLALLPLWIEYELLPRIEARQDRDAEGRETLDRTRALLDRDVSGPKEFRLPHRWAVARADLLLIDGDLSEATRRLGAAPDGDAAPVVKRKLAWLMRHQSDTESARAMAEELRRFDPRPSVRAMLEQGQLQRAWQRIEALAGSPHDASLRQLWCGYAFRFRVETIPRQCTELEPSLIRALWLGVDDETFLTPLERSLVAAHRLVERGACKAAPVLAPTFSHAAPPFELYAGELALEAALCKRSPSHADLGRAHEVAAALGSLAPRDPWVLLAQADLELLRGAPQLAQTKRLAALERWRDADPELPLVRNLQAQIEPSRVGAAVLTR